METMLSETQKYRNGKIYSMIKSFAHNQIGTNLKALLKPT